MLAERIAPSRPPLPTPRMPLPRSSWQVMGSVIFALYLRELKTRLGGRWWGLLWAIGEPLLNTALLLLIYSSLRTHSMAGVDTLTFLISGLLPFTLFKSLTLQLMEGIDANQGLFAYKQVHPIDALLSRASVEISLMLGISAITGLILSWSGYQMMPIYPLELLAYSTLIAVFGGSLGLLLAIATTGTLQRVRALIRMAFFPIYLTSGVILPVSSLPQAARDIVLLNPLSHLIESLRIALLGHHYQSADGVNCWLPLAWSLCTMTFGLSLYRWRKDRLRTL